MRAFTFCFVGVLIGFTDLASANGSPASMLSQSLLRLGAKEVGEDVAARIAKELGSEVVERVSAKVMREGGEALVTETAELTVRYGPEILRALDNAPSPNKIVQALNQLPDVDVQLAASRLAAGARGRELAAATEELGVEVLKSEIKHPGVGLEIMRTWPGEGAALCRGLQREEAIALGKYLDDLAEIPLAQRNELQQVVAADPRRFFAWLRNFIEKNPGKTIGSVTFLALFLPNSDRILGGDEIAFDEAGVPYLMSKSGLLSLPTKQLTDTLQGKLAWLLAGSVALFLIWLCRFLGLHRGWIMRRSRRRRLR